MRSSPIASLRSSHFRDGKASDPTSGSTQGGPETQLRRRRGRVSGPSPAGGLGMALQPGAQVPCVPRWVGAVARVLAKVQAQGAHTPEGKTCRSVPPSPGSRS